MGKPYPERDTWIKPCKSQRDVRNYNPGVVQWAWTSVDHAELESPHFLENAKTASSFSPQHTGYLSGSQRPKGRLSDPTMTSP